MTNGFFEEREEQSAIKAEIVQKYFSAWAKIILSSSKKFGNSKIAYIDLYAGPGRYKDGAASTPLLVLQRAIDDPAIGNALVTLFNDQDKNNTQALQTAIDALPGIKKLKFPPVVNCNSVGKDAEEYFANTKIIPSFTFLDPFGYLGLSMRLVNGVVKDWGCDCVFFFNYNRINSGLSNPSVQAHMAALFGPERAEQLKSRIEGTRPALRETMVLEGLTEALAEMGAKFVLPFRFRNATGRPSHYLVFVSKNFKGYEVMKQIMANASSSADEGVASFGYSPADRSMPYLFELTRPLHELEGMLKEEYSGRTLSLLEIYQKHSVGRPYLSKHYKEILKKMEASGYILVSDPDGKPRRMSAFPDRLVVTFPKVSE